MVYIQYMVYIIITLYLLLAHPVTVEGKEKISS